MNRYSNSENILVSISCVVYNQENYITTCIEGFLQQETSFEYEILIHDDASTDNTVKILKDLESIYPKRLNIIYQTENKFSKYKGGMHARFNFPRAKGKYIAMCDGDDFWIDPMKLQRQVDFLEANKNYVIHHTNYRILLENREFKDFNHHSLTRSTDFFDLLKGNFIVNSSVLFRKSNFSNFPDWISKVFAGDWAFYLYLTRKGEKIYFDITRSVVYRKNVGIYRKYKDPLLNLEKILELKNFLLKDSLFSPHLKEIKSSIRETELNIMAVYIKKGDYINSFPIFTKLFFKNPYKVGRTFAYCLKLRIQQKL